MVRKPKNKKITCEILSLFYKPAGIHLKDMEISILSKEELEAFRLKDFCDMDQKDASEYMNISQPTFHRLLKSARKKIIDALINNKAIKIESQGSVMEKKSNYKVAICAKGTSKEDEIDETFARANVFQIYTIENHKIIDEKIINNDRQNQRGGTGIDTAKMLLEEEIQYVICKNIGPRVSDIFNQFNITVFTKSGSIKNALKNFMNNMEEK